MGLYLTYQEDGAPVLLDDPPEPDKQARAQEGRKKAEQERADLIRRRDAVVDAARTLEDLSPDGVRALVTRRWRGTKVLEEADVESFSADAVKQRELDVADALDSIARRGVYGRGEKYVSVGWPRGWLRRSLRAMNDDEVAAVLGRLRDRGWTQGQIDTSVVRRYRSELSRRSGQ
jgi:hypothetical protein